MRDDAVSPPDRAARLVLTLGLALGFAVMTAWAFLPVSTLLNWIPDDSFYYFQPASLMARGYIPSFDGVNVGTGFHPLWMLLLIPVFRLKEVNADLPVHLALTLSAALFTFAGYLVYKILRRLDVAPLFSAYGAAAFVLWPGGIAIAVDGEVTPVNLCVLGLLLLHYLKIFRAEAVSRRDALVFGLMGGLAFLARNDNVILFILLLAVFILRKRNLAAWPTAALALASAAVVVLPWVVWNFALTKKLFPSSTDAVPTMLHVYYLRHNSGSTAAVAQAVKNLATEIKTLARFSPLSVGIIFFYGFVTSWAARGDRGRRNNFYVLLTFLSFFVLLYVLNVGVRWYIRFWHLGVGLLVNQLFLWWGLHLWAEHARRPRLVAHGAALCLLALFAVTGVYLAATPYYPWQDEMRAGGAWARAHARERVGAFNAGIIAYYGADNVVDLDGNMNASALQALKRRELYKYCAEQGIAYIVDFDMAAVERYRRFWPEAMMSRLKPVRKFDDKVPVYYDSTYYIYKLE